MTKEVKIGLIGIAALAMLIYGINYLKGIPYLPMVLKWVL